MQSKAFLNRGNIQTVNVKALNCKNWLFPHEIFLPFFADMGREKNIQYCNFALYDIFK